MTQIGAILVPLNYRLVAADHEYIINHAGVKAVLVDHEYTEVVDEIRPNLTTRRALDRGAGRGRGARRAGPTGSS